MRPVAVGGGRRLQAGHISGWRSAYRGSMVEATPLGPRFHEALVYASQHFTGRRRGNTHVPAIAHAMAVCALTLDVVVDEDEAIAALLHDVVEDGGGQEALDHIRATWGEVVAQLVLELTDEIEESGRPWMELKRESLERMRDESAAALRIALADKADNARTLVRAVEMEGAEVLDRHSAGSREAVLWYYDALVDGFHERSADLGRSSMALLDEFARSVCDLRAGSASTADPLGSSA